MTDNELKLALVKMLPDVLAWNIETNSLLFLIPSPYRWTPQNPRVLETELLHICWLIEQTLTKVEFQAFVNALYRQDNKYNWHPDCSASWQQRAAALLKVKGLL